MKPARASLRLIAAAGVATFVLAGASIFALAISKGAFSNRWAGSNTQCSAPNLPGALVQVTLANMGGAMMGAAQGGPTMRIFTNIATVPTGTVSLRVANTGTLVHELVVLPLPAGQRVGHRPIGNDDRVDETGSLGEASRTCGAGRGDGIDPASMTWTTLHLAPGNYELVCNLPGHYAAGMYTELSVA